MAQVRQLAVRPEYAEYLVNTWTLQNACVAFHTRRNTSFRSQWISRRGVAATVFGFSEYVNGYQRLSWVRPELPSDDLDGCAVGEAGVAISFPANNVYHALFHAVPAWRALGRVSGQLIPLVGEHAGRWIGRGGSWRAHAWEFLARALTTRAPDALFSDLKRLLTARCTCFQHVVGNTEAFEPRAPGSRGALQAFCRAALRNSARFASGAAALPRPHRLYVARRGARSLHNEEAGAAANVGASADGMLRVELKTKAGVATISVPASALSGEADTSALSLDAFLHALREEITELVCIRERVPRQPQQGLPQGLEIAIQRCDIEIANSDQWLNTHLVFCTNARFSIPFKTLEAAA